ncbi:hypothetical protein TREMEDRAFT_65638 [Tremella mesenterica DSM 1558]|uniref:uncharacterized protein n=1 Tax=Tremella mesenterica (strain ATCC 24925 / CBS 8224 / DSM 1558 / NBRC 9311 / NRRL Y-6157 / RJB 2259-6 / UBC 559-6) TaxID=578456 RepID=UPI00032D5A53|nr:uncharacterized protein TREMEDRAFT_65638 [Tremella mesenterica DSM 1558]EIW66361.1 hypothetical protein TREMEDRAFT_65638 [Tremella mesenterica DSM 1558]
MTRIRISGWVRTPLEVHGSLAGSKGGVLNCAAPEVHVSGGVPNMYMEMRDLGCGFWTLGCVPVSLMKSPAKSTQLGGPTAAGCTTLDLAHCVYCCVWVIALWSQISKLSTVLQKLCTTALQMVVQTVVPPALGITIAIQMVMH